MSWDVVLFKSRQSIGHLSELDENELELTDFNQVFEKSFKEIKQDGDHREILGEDFSIDYFLSEPSSNIILSLYGEKAMFMLVKLAIEYGWQIYDSGIDAMIDLSNPLHNGFEKHQSFVKYIINKDNNV